MSLPHYPLNPSYASSPPPDDGSNGGIFRELLGELPEFAPLFRELEASADGDPEEPIVLAELADFVSFHLAALETERSLLQRAVDALEDLICDLDDDELGSELVGFAFFDGLSLADRRVLTPRLGPRSLQLLEAMSRDSFE